jgi:hypothetical protein
VRYVFAFAPLTLAGCVTSSDVSSFGQDVFSVRAESLPCGLALVDDAKASVDSAASEFCAAKGLQLELARTITSAGLPLVHCATAELHFRCIDRSTVK